MADFISLIHIYCQKASLPAPVFTIQETEPTSQEFLNLQYIYKSTLQIDNETFEGSWEKSKSEAKKSVAQKAWESYKEQGNPFFTAASQEKLVNYTNQLNQLCNSLQIPLPHFILKGFHNDTLGPFRGECYVAGKSFIDSRQCSKKIQAKEAIAKIALLELMQDSKVKECLENKQAYKIDPKELQQQFLKHFQRGSSDDLLNSSTLQLQEQYRNMSQDKSLQENYDTEYSRNEQGTFRRFENNGGDDGRNRAERTHFTFPAQDRQSYPDEIEIPAPNFDDLLDREYRNDSSKNYQRHSYSNSLENDGNFQNSSSSYYNGSSMWYTQPAFDSSRASPFGHGPPNMVKPEQPDLVVVFDRKSEGKNEMERRNDLEEYANWSSRSERPGRYRAGSTFDFPRGRSTSRNNNRSLSRSPSHRHRRHRSRSVTRSPPRSNFRQRRSRRRNKSVDETEKSHVGKRRKSSPCTQLSIPANMGKYGTLIFEMAIENPALGTPHFSTKPSPFIVHEFIAILSIGSKLFMSTTSHAKEIDAIEDVAKIAHEELQRMLEINKKMQQYKSISKPKETEKSVNSSSTIRKENGMPDTTEISILKEISKNDSIQSVSVNKSKINSSKDYEMSKEDNMLYGDGNQDDPDFIRLEPAPRSSFTEKFKRADSDKRSQMEAIRKKRETLNDNISESITRVAVGKVKGENSDED